MLSEAIRTQAARSLIRAEQERKPVVQLSKTWPEITLEDAYAIQALVNDMKVAQGSKTIGNKIGLTSKAMQQSSQIDEPDFGYLFDTMMIPDGAKIPHANFCRPRVEIDVIRQRDLSVDDLALRACLHLAPPPPP